MAEASPAGAARPASIERGTIGGVEAVWAEGTEPFSAGLLFRVGTADETLATSGITHLVEHLAFTELGRTDHVAQGSVGAIVTSFVASGSKDEVTRFLNHVCAALCNPPTARLQHEIGVLKTEEASAGGGIVPSLLLYRFGARGLGLRFFKQLGLLRITPEALQAWARERFTGGNAVVWLTGPPPDGLAFDLPPGTRVSPPRVEALDRPFPLFVDEGSGIVSVSLVGQRTTPFRTVVDVARQRIETKLRHERGLTYHVFGQYDPVSATEAHVVIAADCLDENAPQVAQVVVETLDELAREGISADERTRLTADADRAATSETTPESLASYVAYELLIGSEPLLPDQFVAEMAAVDERATATTLSEAMETLILQAPEGVAPPDARFGLLPAYSSEHIVGKTYSGKRTIRSLGQSVGPSIVVNDDALMYAERFDRFVTIPFAQCEALLRWSDGKIALIGQRGQSIEISTATFGRGAELLETILERVSADRIVPMDGS